MSRHRDPDRMHKTGLLVPAGEPDPLATVHEFLEECSLTEQHLFWINEMIVAKPRWQVCRTDDNGNDFIMFNAWEESEAARMVGEYERRGHKQHYWYCQAPPLPVTSSVIAAALKRHRMTAA